MWSRTNQSQIILWATESKGSETQSHEDRKDCNYLVWDFVSAQNMQYPVNTPCLASRDCSAHSSVSVSQAAWPSNHCLHSRALGHLHWKALPSWHHFFSGCVFLSTTLPIIPSQGFVANQMTTFLVIEILNIIDFVDYLLLRCLWLLTSHTYVSILGLSY